VLIAIRDMLHLASSAREVKAMIHHKTLKHNGRLVRDMHESIALFGQLEADKNYRLSLLPAGKFTFKELKKQEDKLCKVIGKRLVAAGKTQLNLHDGTNVVAREKKDALIAIGDSLHLDENNKVKTHLALEKGREVFITGGKHLGVTAKVAAVANGRVTVIYEGGQATLAKSAVFVTG
jgi:small subunit ribosomal protein S4e